MGAPYSGMSQRTRRSQNGAAADRRTRPGLWKYLFYKTDNLRLPRQRSLTFCPNTIRIAYRTYINTHSKCVLRLSSSYKNNRNFLVHLPVFLSYCVGRGRFMSDVFCPFFLLSGMCLPPYTSPPTFDHVHIIISDVYNDLLICKWCLTYHLN